MAGNFFRGTTVEQDGRWGKSDEKLLAKMTKEGKFDPILEVKVDISKVNTDIMSKWVAEKVNDLLGFEDDILPNLVMNILTSKNCDAKKLQLDVTGFMHKKAGPFCAELWTLLVDAQGQPQGIPTAFIQKKREEILQRQKLSTVTLIPPAPTLSVPSTNGASSRWGQLPIGSVVSTPSTQHIPDSQIPIPPIEQTVKTSTRDEYSKDEKDDKLDARGGRPSIKGESHSRSHSRDNISRKHNSSHRGKRNRSYSRDDKEDVYVDRYKRDIRDFNSDSTGGRDERKHSRGREERDRNSRTDRRRESETGSRGRDKHKKRDCSDDDDDDDDDDNDDGRINKEYRRESRDRNSGRRESHHRKHNRNDSRDRDRDRNYRKRSDGDRVREKYKDDEADTQEDIRYNERGGTKENKVKTQSDDRVESADENPDSWGRHKDNGSSDRRKDHDKDRVEDRDRGRDRDRDRGRGRVPEKGKDEDDVRHDRAYKTRDHDRDHDRDYDRDHDRDYGRDHDRDYGRDHDRDNIRDHDRNHGRDHHRVHDREEAVSGRHETMPATLQIYDSDGDNDHSTDKEQQSQARTGSASGRDGVVPSARQEDQQRTLKPQKLRSVAVLPKSSTWDRDSDDDNDAEHNDGQQHHHVKNNKRKASHHISDGNGDAHGDCEEEGGRGGDEKAQRETQLRELALKSILSKRLK